MDDSRRGIARRLGQLLIVVVALYASSGFVAGQGFSRPTPDLGVWTIAISIGLTAFAGLVLLGFFPDYGYGVLDTIAENPFVTALFGVGGLLSMVVVVLVAVVIAIVPFVGPIIAFVIVVSLGIVTLLWTTAGYIAIGRFVAGRVGVDNVWAGFAIGLGLFAIVQVLPTLVAVPLSLPAIILGIGGGLRQWLGSGGSRSERSVPPATRV